MTTNPIRITCRSCGARPGHWCTRDMGAGVHRASRGDDHHDVRRVDAAVFDQRMACLGRNLAVAGACAYARRLGSHEGYNRGFDAAHGRAP